MGVGRPKNGERPNIIEQQKLFVAEYLVDRNGTQAAIRAGYSPKAAARTASRLLQLPWVKELVDAKTAERADKLEITAERVLKEFARIAFVQSDAAITFGPGGVSLKDCNDLSEDVLAAISEVGETTTENGGSVRLKYHNKLDALNALAKHLQLFPKEQIEITADEKLQGALGKLAGTVKRFAG